MAHSILSKLTPVVFLALAAVVHQAAAVVTLSIPAVVTYGDVTTLGWTRDATDPEEFFTVVHIDNQFGPYASIETQGALSGELTQNFTSLATFNEGIHIMQAWPFDSPISNDNTPLGTSEPFELLFHH
ncbi:hypothetical protein C8J56DRAFT_933012 [Mycena floridula]|nr:hypothetical protein C8J56DRAFT_933012 [Mycena floridula]